MGYAQPYFISPAYAFVAYPNRNSVPFREFYRIPEAETVVRGTLRYQGFPEFVKALVELGWLNPEPQEWLTEGLTWAQVMQKTIGAGDASERYVFYLQGHAFTDIPPALSLLESRSCAPSLVSPRVTVLYRA